MAVTEASLANLEGHKFKKGQSGNPHGRPKNRVVTLLNDIFGTKRMKILATGLTREEIDTIERQLLQLETPEIQAIAKDERTPTYLKAMAIAILIDMRNGRTATVDRLRDRQYGAVTQSVEVSEKKQIESMTDEEIRAEIERIRASRDGGDK